MEDSTLLIIIFGSDQIILVEFWLCRAVLNLLAFSSKNTSQALTFTPYILPQLRMWTVTSSLILAGFYLSHPLLSIGPRNNLTT